MAKVVITLVKSPIGYEKSQRDTVVALGFKRGKRVVEHEATPQINGMINKISHLLKVEYKWGLGNGTGKYKNIKSS